MKKIILSILFLVVGFAFAGPNLIENDFKAKTFKRPLREISVIVTEDGFFPNKIMAFEGEQVRFYITSTTDKKDCFLLQKHDVFLSAEKGKINEALIEVDGAGRFKFYCPATKHSGFFTVFEKDTPKEEVKRSIASEDEKPKYWIPRDYDQ